jgi:hypothetical protein
MPSRDTPAGLGSVVVYRRDFPVLGARRGGSRLERACGCLDILLALERRGFSESRSSNELLSWLTPGSQVSARLTPDPRLPTGLSESDPSLADISGGVPVRVVGMSTAHGGRWRMAAAAAVVKMIARMLVGDARRSSTR